MKVVLPVKVLSCQKKSALASSRHANILRLNKELGESETRMFQKTAIALAMILFVTGLFANEVQGLDSAKRRFAQAGYSERSRMIYVETLARLLGHEISEHIFSGGHNSQIDEINTELKRYPAPQNSDSEKLSALREGKWQSTRHTFIYCRDGTWRLAPESGTTHGHWHIAHNQFFTDDVAYTIILLNRDYFVFTDGEYVFYEYRLPKTADNL